MRDLVVLSIKGLTCLGDTTLRASLRKKKIRLKVVKNSLTRRVFDELGMKINPESPCWKGPSVMAYGASSIAELSQEIDKELRQPKLAALYKDKVSVKGAVADGLEVAFDVALKMPTRLEAIGRVITLALSPASRIAGAARGPGRQGRQPDQDHQRKGLKPITPKTPKPLPAEAPAAS